MTSPARSALSARIVERAPGVALCAAIAAVATAIGAAIPVVGAALPAVVFGLVVALIRRPGDALLPGIRYAGKFLLQLAVVLLGIKLSLGQVAEVGLESLPVLLGSLVACLLAAWLVGRWLGVPSRLRTLIGVGTGICGASAIAAVAPVVGATAAEISYAVSTIFLFNVTAVAVFPLLGHAFGMDPHTFGLFAGTAVNDTSSVVAAASVFSASALGFAIVVKLVRTLAIIPITAALSIAQARKSGAASLGARGLVKLVPWFLIGFVIVVILRTLIPVPEGVVSVVSSISTFLIATALAGIGLSTDVQAIRRSGWRPLLLGGVLWAVVTVVTLAVIALR